jgi:amino acid transporter
MWIGYVIALALYAQGFAGYAMTFVPPHSPHWLAKAFGVGIVLLFTAVNMVGAQVVGRSETFIVVVKLVILGVFAVAGLWFIHPGYLTPELWPSAHEGFGLVANAAEDMDDPRKLLPKALYLSVIAVILIYLAVSVAVIGNLDIRAILAAKDYALAEAAKPFLGDFGFRLIAIGALFSTASAINATLFGAANVSYTIARDGELPGIFSLKVRQNATGGLFITAAFVILFILFFDLSGIAMMGSGAFLLIYACVHAAHLRVADETGGNRWIVSLSLVSCLAMLAILSVYIYENSRPALITMLALIPICLAAEWAYRKATGRTIRTRA